MRLVQGVWFMGFLIVVVSAVRLLCGVTHQERGDAVRAERAPAPRADPRAAAQDGAALAALQRIVADIQRADYRGDLEALERGHGALAAYADDPALAEAVRYWCGFALWRLALNRMNAQGFDRPAVIGELRAAVAAFLSVTEDGLIADAKSAAAGCLMSVLYLTGGQDAQAQTESARFRALLEESVAAAPDNPRVLWVLGGKQLWTPKEFGGSRALAIGTYERGLAATHPAAAAADAVAPKPLAPRPLAPGWGEPELLMALAYAYSGFEPFDLVRAESYAREALALQPEWHYVRDILLPSIRTKASADLAPQAVAK